MFLDILSAPQRSHAFFCAEQTSGLQAVLQMNKIMKMETVNGLAKKHVGVLLVAIVALLNGPRGVA
jgi:hypothetical protein